jgi:hypothetical protein
MSGIAGGVLEFLPKRMGLLDFNSVLEASLPIAFLRGFKSMLLLTFSGL